MRDIGSASFNRTQRRAKNNIQWKNEILKIGKVQRKNIAWGEVISLPHAFLVPKGVEDNRIVYNGTSNDLNDLL